MIYLLEDDDGVRSYVLYALESSGFEAMGFEKPSLFWNALSNEMPDLLLLDIMLPEEDGLSVLSKLRKAPDTAALPGAPLPLFLRSSSSSAHRSGT